MSESAERDAGWPRGLPHAAAMLAYAGALPLIAGAILTLVRPADYGPEATRLMLLFGGLLIAFFGGVRWGIAVMRPEGPGFAGLIGGVVPLAISAAIFLLDGETARFIVILATLPLLLADDLRATRRGGGAPEWYLGVRTPLTVLMEASFLTAFAARLLG